MCWLRLRAPQAQNPLLLTLGFAPRLRSATPLRQCPGRARRSRPRSTATARGECRSSHPTEGPHRNPLVRSRPPSPAAATFPCPRDQPPVRSPQRGESGDRALGGLHRYLGPGDKNPHEERPRTGGLTGSGVGQSSREWFRGCGVLCGISS